MSLDTTRLRRLARRPVFRRWAVANLVARLPNTMNLLALVLVGEAATGSVAAGAQLAGVATLTNALSAQWRGRTLDRVELRVGLRRSLVATAVVILAIVAATVAAAPFVLLALLAALEGLAFAPILGGFRALLVVAVEGEELEAAIAIDAVFVEVAFVTGPALAGLAALVVGPLGVLGLMVASLLTAVVLVGSLPPRPPEPAADVGVAPLLQPGATRVYLLTLGVGLVIGTLEAAVPLRLEAAGLDAATAGPFLAATALGSGLAGLVASAQVDGLAGVRAKVAVLLAVLATLFVCVALTEPGLLFVVALFGAGLPLAPLNAMGSLVLQRVVPRARQAEGFAVFTAAILAGAGLGQLLVGGLAGAVSSRSFFLGGALLAAVLTVVVLAAALRRRALGLPQAIHGPAGQVRPVPARAS